ncbi:copia protein [Tanacetum coccineum]
MESRFNIDRNIRDVTTLWHRRLGHANMRLIQSLASKELVTNLPKLKLNQHFYDACKIGKQAHASHKDKNTVSTTRCLELLHMDLFGPSTVWSYGGNLYTLVIVDDYSRILPKQQILHYPKQTHNENQRSLNVTFDEIPPPSKTSPLVDDDLDKEEAIKVTEKKNLENKIEDETLEVDKVVNIKESKNHSLDNVIETLTKELLGTKWVFRKKLDENGIVSQNEASILKMLKKFGLKDSKPMKMPMSSDTKLTKDEECESVDSTKYRGMIGDYVDRKSTSGICIFIGCCLTSWFSKKQTFLAISTTEAECVSAEKACQQALWMKQALIDYDIRLDDVSIICDNKGAINLSKNPVQHSRTKHIKIRHHFHRDNVQKGNISIKKVSSEDNIVGILTKPLKRESFNYLCLEYRERREEWTRELRDCLGEESDRSDDYESGFSPMRFSMYEERD